MMAELSGPVTEVDGTPPRGVRAHFNFFYIFLEAMIRRTRTFPELSLMSRDRRTLR